MLLRIANRLGITLFSIAAVIVISFALTRLLPGDTAAYFAGPAATEQAIQEVRVKLGLDKSKPEQFVRYLADLSRGDLGQALSTGQPVTRDLITRLPASAELTLFALLISMSIAIPLGVFAAVKEGSFVDHAARIIATAGVSLPVFFTGLLLSYFFYFRWGLSPAPNGRLDIIYSAPAHVTGFYLIDSLIERNGEVFMASLKQLLLPAATLAIFSLAPITRITRASMLSV
ncbi:MAG TPA: ABC transporter permease, partial [Xanthobacteraceae bacterium]|nr:ABC transporter permease [Xanthobacteraceae bacterium]